jgi:hypothetical protein
MNDIEKTKVAALADNGTQIPPAFHTVAWSLYSLSHHGSCLTIIALKL